MFSKNEHICLEICTVRHRGKILENIVRLEKYPIKKLSEKLGYKSRTTIYLHFQDPALPMEIIQNYSRVLKKDFSREYPDLINLGDPVIEIKEKNVQELEALVDYWKTKYIDLLEKQNEMFRIKAENSDNNPT